MSDVNKENINTTGQLELGFYYIEDSLAMVLVTGIMQYSVFCYLENIDTYAAIPISEFKNKFKYLGPL